MKRFLICLLFFLVSASFAKTLVAVVETKVDGDVLTHAERLFLTDKLRSIANLVFSGDPNYTILTRENINVMLPEGKSIEDCEGSCLAETGRMIAADYIAQARVGRFSDKLSLTVEMYETRSGKLVASFTGQSYDADGLLNDIDTYAEGFFRKARRGGDDGSSYNGRDGFSDISSGDSYSYRRGKSYIIQVESYPAGALLSVDGDPISNCKETPCKVQLRAGSHRFSLVMDQYFKKDSIINITDGTSIEFTLKPRFGVLNVEPRFEGNSYNERGGAVVTIDEVSVDLGENQLDPGTHRLTIKHRCYEPLSATVNIKIGSNLTFDKMMKLAKGGLSLTAIRDDEPVEEPVYVNGTYVGTTPFDGEVPICGVVTIGRNRKEVPVNILYHDEVSYTYEFESTRRNKWRESAYRELDDYDYGNSYESRSMSEGNSTSYSSSRSETETFSLSDYETDDVKFFFQGLAGIGFDAPSDQPDDDIGLTYMMEFYYAEAIMGVKMKGGLFVGAGFGLGAQGPSVMESSSGSDYYGGGLSADEVNDMLPSKTLAFLLTLELGYDFTLDGAGTCLEAAFGMRLGVILGDNPVISLNGFFECLGWIGMEMGVASITDDFLETTTVGFSFRLYLRFPGRPSF